MLYRFNVQQSAQSRSKDIKQRWNQTENFAKDYKDTIYVLLSDEIVLVEYSPYPPLKAFHHKLSNATQDHGFVLTENPLQINY